MRKAKKDDCWKYTDSRKGFPLWVDQISVRGILGFDDLEIQLDSGVSVFCGKNGSGKTTLLKIIYKVLSGDEHFDEALFKRLDISQAEVVIKNTKGELDRYIEGNDKRFEKIEYFDPAAMSVLIVQRILSDSNVSDWIEGVEASQVLNDRIEEVRRVTGKKYERVDFFEVTGVLNGDEILPYIQVSYRGCTYTNESMGLGEHKMLLMLWKLFTLDRSSILLIEEPEAFLCPKSQVEFMDVVAHVSCKSHSIILLSSHSEHVVSKVSLDSRVIMLDSYSKGFSLVRANHHFKYIDALGLSSPKIGCLLVEDDFAGLVLARILIRNDSFIHHSYHIANQKGEANIEKLIKHYEKRGAYKFIGVFDADQKGKVNEDEFSWPICFLPGESPLPPEKLVIEDFKVRSDVYAEKLGVELTRVIDVLSVEIDHHDFFIEVSRELKVGLTTLKDIAVDLWLDSQLEKEEEFLFAIENFGSKVTAYVEHVGDEYLLNVANKFFYPSHSKNEYIDLSKLLGKKLNGYVQYSQGEPVYRILE